MTPVQRKRSRDRATRALRNLKEEEKRFGCIDDSAGKRYRVGPYFLLAGDLAKAGSAFEWFEERFPDDGGEPAFYLYGALTAYRQGDRAKARVRLLKAMLSNIYLLPHLTGKAVDTEGVWHSSNRVQKSYLEEVGEFLDEPTAEERRWMAAGWDSPPFKALREGYLETYRALSRELDTSKRRMILSRWDKLQAQHFALLV